VYAYRAAEASEWVLTRCYCVDCTGPEIETPTLGTSEVLVDARLEVLSLSAEQRHTLCLHEVSVLAFSPLMEGDEP
jgi:hypothetical protein